MHILRLQREGAHPQVFEGDLVTIGRSTNNMMVVRDSRISSVHGEIIRRDSNFYYRDLGSTNGSLVLSRDREVVVDGKRIREICLGDGDELRLGDRKRPVRIGIGIIQRDTHSGADGRTVISTRLVGDVGALRTQVVENPLASRQTLGELFSFFAQLAATRSAQELGRRVGQFSLKLLSKNLFATVFVNRGAGLERLSIVSDDPAHVPLIEVADLKRWFPQALDGSASVVLTAPEVLKDRLPVLDMLAAAPLPGESGSHGVLVLGRSVGFSDFDLDIMSLVGHQAALQFEKIQLIERLEIANAHLLDENRELLDQLGDAAEKRPVLGQSAPWQRVMKQVGLVAGANTTILVLGETGTGKELVARELHDGSPRSDELFVAVNCGALAESLLESELFGYVKGAFTGADRDRQGLFEAASGGTLFLDEIGDISPKLQVKLLRVLEGREITPVGGTQTRAIDVRVVCATHKDLDIEVKAGRFREDLLYRINVFPLSLPPLRDRDGDVMLLARHFLDLYAGRLGRRLPGFSDEAIGKLEQAAWPGNVRQLQNEIHRAVLLADDDAPIGPAHFSDRIAGVKPAAAVADGPLKTAVERFEEGHVRRVLTKFDGNRTRTAKALQISRQALTEKLKKYKVAPRHAKPKK